MFPWVNFFRRCVLGLALFLCLPAAVFAADSPASLSARESGVPLYARQDLESEPIDRLEKGDILIPMAKSVGQEIWYMVRTKAGLIGWVRAVDVVVTGHTNWAVNCVIDGKVVTGAAHQGRLVTDIDLMISRATKNPTKISVNNVIVTRTVSPAADLTALVAEYKTLSAPLANRIVGTISAHSRGVMSGSDRFFSLVTGP